ncbi:MAG TPA: RDD family protein [Kofleriaceae bacterium]|nr:RDD family protein [Kofleriaceae bacterium]
MPDREPALLRGPSRDEPFHTTAEPGSQAPGTEPPPAAKPPARPASEPPLPPGYAYVTLPPRRDAPTVYVVGFWRRLVAAAIDLAVVIPVSLLITLIASRISGVHLPPSSLRLVDVDLWIDLVLATDPALVMGLVLFCAIGLTYLLLFQIVVGRTLGMRVLHIKIIDIYGDPPSAARCALRCAGYLASVATLFLGFLWMGFDSEKRALQDWIAGTYVIRA